MLDKTQLTKVAVAGFGAAMASVYAIPEAHATIIPISFSPTSVSFGSQVPGTTVAFSTASGPVFEVSQFNDGIGKTIHVDSSLGSLVNAAAGSLLSPGSFASSGGVAQSPAATGSGYVGFRTDAGKVGWFEVNWGGAGGAVKYLKGAYANAGESIIVGQLATGVPEPSEIGLLALGLLALGAAGVRQRREARKLVQPRQAA